MLEDLAVGLSFGSEDLLNAFTLLLVISV